MKTINIIDYGLCNIHSVKSAITKLGYKPKLIDKIEGLPLDSKVILPGVGSFANGISKLDEMGLIDSIKKHIENQGYFLGICLGMQMMFDKSSESKKTNGLGIIRGEIDLIPNHYKNKKHKVPHIGWNKLIIDNDFSKSIIKNDYNVYFVHSYMAKNIDSSNIIATCKYNNIEIPAIVKYKNSYGCQFHPEKSGETGLDILKSILDT